MTVEMKQLIAKERYESGERRKKETEGTYVLLYFLTGFYVMESALWGFHYDGFLDAPFMFLWIGYIATVATNTYIFTVKENGHRENIFEKYMYIPVDMKKLFCAKIYIASLYIIKVTLAAQIVAFVVRCLEVRYEGGCLFDALLFVPGLTGIIIWMIELFAEGTRYREKCL